MNIIISLVKFDSNVFGYNESYLDIEMFSKEMLEPCGKQEEIVASVALFRPNG